MTAKTLGKLMIQLLTEVQASPEVAADALTSVLVCTVGVLGVRPEDLPALLAESIGRGPESVTPVRACVGFDPKRSN